MPDIDYAALTKSAHELGADTIKRMPKRKRKIALEVLASPSGKREFLRAMYLEIIKDS
jgi:hypothetical protein